MKNKKFFAKALAFALVMGTVGAHGVAGSPVATVQAAVIEPTDVTFQAADYELEITLGSGNVTQYVRVQVLKDEKGDKVSAEYWYPVNTANKLNVDLSFLKATKEQYVRVYCMDITKAKTVKIPAQPKTEIKFDAKTQKFVDKAKSEITDLSVYDYKTLYGSDWNSDLSTLTVAQAAIAGTTLIVRQSANTTKKTPAGTEVKVKIPALAKAPKVTVDYKKGTITLPKGVEVAVTADVTTLPGDADWKKFDGKLSQDDLLEKAGKELKSDASGSGDALKKSGYVLYVRTAATTKKAASNVAIVEINKSPIVATTDSKSIINKTVADDKDKVSLTLNTSDITLTLENNATSTWAYSLDGGNKWTVIDVSATLPIYKNDKFKICVPAGEDSFGSNILEVTVPNS